ncbi:MAG: response regulator transcription factor [Pseudomonadales bacterium]|nr:response regulator transcription factor [Pseudomonadales bacterium]
MRLLLVEDNQRLAGLIQQVVEKAGHKADVVHNRQAALHAFSSFEYALLVLDRGLPDGDGISLLRQLRKRGVKQPCLMLTARDALRDRVDGLDAGADDYLTKPFANEELVARINALLRRPVELFDERLQRGNVSIELKSRRIEVDGTTLELSTSEFAALECLLRCSGRCSRQRLEDGIYGMDVAVTPNALDVLMYRLRKQLTKAGASIRIRSVRGFGYVLEEL